VVCSETGDTGAVAVPATMESENKVMVEPSVWSKSTEMPIGSRNTSFAIVIATPGLGGVLVGMMSGIAFGSCDGGGVMAGVPVADTMPEFPVDTVEVGIAADSNVRVRPLVSIVVGVSGKGIVVPLCMIPDGPRTTVVPSFSVIVVEERGNFSVEPSTTTTP
jgi:hypothetical protein